MQLIPHKTELWAAELRNYDPSEFRSVKGIFVKLPEAILASKLAYPGLEVLTYEDGSPEHKYYFLERQTHVCVRRFVVNTMHLPPEIPNENKIDEV